MTLLGTPDYNNMTFTPAQPLREPKLAGKLLEVTRRLGWIARTGLNPHHKYKFAEASQVISRVRKELAKVGVFLQVSVISVDRQNTLTIVHMKYTLIDAETGERSSTEWAGEGADSQDKGLNKAYTASMKYWLINQFMLPLGEDAEADGDTDKRGGVVRSDGMGTVATGQRTDTEVHPPLPLVTTKVAHDFSKPWTEPMTPEKALAECERFGWKFADTTQEAVNAERRVFHTLAHECVRIGSQPKLFVDPQEAGTKYRRTMIAELLAIPFESFWPNDLGIHQWRLINAHLSACIAAKQK